MADLPEPKHSLNPHILVQPPSSHEQKAENDHHQGENPPITSAKLISGHFNHLLFEVFNYLDEGGVQLDTLQRIFFKIFISLKSYMIERNVRILII
jgi:hypothetical protein